MLVTVLSPFYLGLSYNNNPSPLLPNQDLGTKMLCSIKKFARKNSNPTSSISTSIYSIVINRKSTPRRGVPLLLNNPFGLSSPATR